MRDKFIFSDGQTYSSISDTGEVSDNIWDLEEDVSVDQQVLGWINIIIMSFTYTSGLDEGLLVEVRASDAAALTSPEYLGIMQINLAEIKAGEVFNIGVCKSKLMKYLGTWVRAVTTALVGSVVVDIRFSEAPISKLNIQKKP